MLFKLARLDECRGIRLGEIRRSESAKKRALILAQPHHAFSWVGYFEHHFKALHGRQITDPVRLCRGVSERARAKHLIKLIVDYFAMLSPIIAFH